MQAFEVLRSLETRRLSGNTVMDILNPNKSILLVDDDAHCISVYRGENASLVLYLVALRLAKELQRIMKGTYSIKNLDDAASIESIGAANLMEKVKIPDLYNPSLYTGEDLSKIQQDNNKAPIETDAAWKEHLSVEKLNLFDSTHLGQSLSKLQDLDPPAGYQCDMVFIDTSVYTPARRMNGFFKTRDISSHFHKLGKLPDGLFFETDYFPRISIKGGKIQSIELFKKSIEPIQGQNKKIIGTIHAPLLYIPRIMTERPLQALQKGFKIPTEPTVDELIEKINASKS